MANIRVYLGMCSRGLKVRLTIKKSVLRRKKSTRLVKKIESGFNF